MFVYTIIDYDSELYWGCTLVSVHKTRESARKEVVKYLGEPKYIEVKEHHEYGMFDEYVYTVTEDNDEVRECFLLIKAMEVEEWA